MTSYRQLITVQVFSKSSFSWGAIYSLEGKGQNFWRHSPIIHVFALLSQTRSSIIPVALVSPFVE